MAFNPKTKPRLKIIQLLLNVDTLKILVRELFMVFKWNLHSPPRILEIDEIYKNLKIYVYPQKF